jgi:hypothetical protein
VDRAAVAKQGVGRVAVERAGHGRDACEPVQPCRIIM